MTTRSLALALALALLAPCAVADARRGCALPRHARVVASSRQTLVWEQTRPVPRYGVLVRDWLGCVRATGRTMRLFHFDDDPSQDRKGQDPAPKQFRLAGAFVAFAFNTGTYFGSGDQFVEVVDLRKRRRAPKLSVHAYNGQDAVSQEYRFRTLALSAHGHVAWIDDAGGMELPATTRVAAHDSHGTRTLDSGAKGTIRKLRIFGETVEWQNSGLSKSAPLS